MYGSFTLYYNKITWKFVWFQKTPFAGEDGNSELSRFYLECQGAPTLTMFQEPQSVEDTLNSITEQLSQFEANTPEFDNFLQSFDSGEDNSDDN